MRSMKAITIFVALILLLLASACIEDVGEPSGSPTSPGSLASPVGDGSRPTTTPPAVLLTPGPDTPTCAADSTQGFLQAQSSASFKVYCPTFLPAGFALEDVHFEEAVEPGTPVPGPGIVVATFKRDSPKASIQFVQGRPALDVITELRTSSEGQPVDGSYDGFMGSIFEKGALARSPDGFTHVILADGLTADELGLVAATMAAVVP
jgi:hypothetical protein